MTTIRRHRLASYLLVGILLVGLLSGLVLNARYFKSPRLITSIAPPNAKGITGLSDLDGSSVVISCEDHLVRRVDLHLGVVTQVYPGLGSSASCVAVSPDHKRVAAGAANGQICVWRAADAELLGTLSGHLGDVRALVFSPAGDVLASGGDDGSIRICSVATRKLRQELRAHSKPITSLAFSSDGGSFFSAGLDARVICWNPENYLKAREITLPERVNTLMSVPVGALDVLLVGGKTIIVIDPRTGAELSQLQPASGPVQALGTTADAKLVAAGTSFGDVVIWSTETWKEVERIKAHDAIVVGVAFMSGSSQLVTACAGIDLSDRQTDGEIRIWKAN